MASVVRASPAERVEHRRGHRLDTGLERGMYDRSEPRVVVGGDVLLDASGHVLARALVQIRSTLRTQTQAVLPAVRGERHLEQEGFANLSAEGLITLI